MWVWSLGWEVPLEKGTTTPSSILAWRIPRTESLAVHRVAQSQDTSEVTWHTHKFYFKRLVYATTSKLPPPSAPATSQSPYCPCWWLRSPRHPWASDLLPGHFYLDVLQTIKKNSVPNSQFLSGPLLLPCIEYHVHLCKSLKHGGLS